MDVYVARQPIFNRDLKLYGYELLYRNSHQNFFAQIDDDQATAELLYNTFLVMGLNEITDGGKGFINFSKDLLDSDVPYLLPPENTVIEILERGEVTPLTIEACKKLKDRGYQLALDDFVFDKENAQLLEIADIVKIEFPAVSIDLQAKLIDQYGSRMRFLAEKVETREDFRLAADMGYHLFQGYFFSKPLVIESKQIEALDTNIFCIIEELYQPEPSFERIAEVIEGDLGLSYKLLKLANSVYFGTKHTIKTIRHALVYIGTKELYQWLSIMMLKGIQTVENAEMIKLSFVRAKMMELLAGKIGHTNQDVGYFFTGLFSNIDVLLNQPMDQVLEGLPLGADVKQALLGLDNELRQALECVIHYEKASWMNEEQPCCACGISPKLISDVYLDSIKWTRKLNYG